MVVNLFSRLLGFLTDETLPPAEPADVLQGYLQRLTDEYNRNVDLLADGLASGRITVQEWDAAMRAEIRAQQLGAAVTGAGGAHLATPETYQLAQRQIDAQMVYFDRWSAELAQQTASGDLPSAAYLSNRARLYGKASDATFHEAVTNARGVPTLPFYPRDGRTDCLVNCCCEWRIVPLRGVDNYDCFWILDPTCDHCPQCAARRAAANPLRVRNGAIVDPERYQAANLYA